MRIMETSKTRRWVGCGDEKTWIVPYNGLLHSLLRKLSKRIYRHSRLRHSEMHAFEMQQALMFGLMDRKRKAGEFFFRYHITYTGQAALKVLDSFKPADKLCQKCRQRVRCLLSKMCLRARLPVVIPIRPSHIWISYFQFKVW